MISPIIPYLVPIPPKERSAWHMRKRVACCPVCGQLDTLKITRDMIHCTNCFWAVELKKAS